MKIVVSSLSSAARRRQRRGALSFLGLACAWLCLSGEAVAQSLEDHFTNRVTFTSATGDLTANNSSATIDPGEPLHGGKRGGHSMWVSWVAPTNCIVRFQTGGSDFDTVLAAYRFRDPGDTTFEQLQLVASEDDSEGFGHGSRVEFGATAGHRYEIAVDGYFGATGTVVLRWRIDAISVAPPVILSIPADRAVQLNEAVELAVTLTNLGTADLRWYFNGGGLDAFTTNLVVASFQTTNVGRYQLRVRVDGQQFYTPPTEVQINTDGATNALARDKTFDALVDGLLLGGGEFRAASGPVFSAAAAGVSRGYNGSQVFNTAYATPDPSEPNHCSLNGGASYWYAYQPPADGTLVLDTIGSSFDTFIAAYTFNPPLTSYADLIPLTCDNDSAGTDGAARLEFAAPRNRQFLLVLDGVNGARGIARLNYMLDTNRLPVVPTLLQSPSPGNMASGLSVILQPAVTGSPPLHFVWHKGTNLLAGETNGFLQFVNITPAHSGEYHATIFSHVGEPLDVLMPLNVVIPPQIQLTPQADRSMVLSFPGIAGQRYVVEQTDALDHPWQPWTNSYSGDGSLIVLTNIFINSNAFLRVRIE